MITRLCDKFEVVALAARKNIALLQEQAKIFHPSLLCVYEEEEATKLQKLLPHTRVVCGDSGLVEVATYEPCDFVMLSMTGSVALPAALAAIRLKKTVALANKEILVSGGELVMQEAKKYGATILPVDSEHNALFQCLQGGKKSEVKRLILTASGGPFRERDKETFSSITLQEALQHPNWKMGQKVSIDCSTLVNKGLEVIEAHFLFDISVAHIEVVIHPQSIVHSLVEFIDGSILAQLSDPDMEKPIQYALTYPDRLPFPSPPFSFPTLSFSPPDPDRFPALKLAFEALEKKKSFPCFFNAANEVLVDRFIQGKIAWTSISEKLQQLLAFHQGEEVLDLPSILSVEKKAKDLAYQI